MVEFTAAMIIQTQQEISQIREALIPAAEDLRSAVKAIPQSRNFAEQTRSDVKKMRSFAKDFRRDIDLHFPKHPDLSEAPIPADVLKKARHDSRNRLNHLFNLVQLLSISEDFSAIESALQNVSINLDKCLSILTVSTVVSPTPPPEAGTLSAHPHPGVLLIADDNEENRNLLARLLEPAGHTLHFAKDGLEAIEAIGNTLYDAVLLDIQMPKMDGFEVLASLRESGHLRQTPVIVVTGLQEEQASSAWFG